MHDIGPILGPDWPERYGSTAFLRLEAGQALAVEPLLYSDLLPVAVGLRRDRPGGRPPLDVAEAV